jgi:hypothetical protein
VVLINFRYWSINHHRGPRRLSSRADLSIIRRVAAPTRVGGTGSIAKGSFGSTIAFYFAIIEFEIIPNVK